MKITAKKIIAYMAVTAVMLSYTAVMASADESVSSDDFSSISDTSSIADSSPDAVNDGRLTLTCEDNGKALSGVNWRIYRIGHREDNTVVMEDGFADLNIDLTAANAKDMEGIAQQISERIKSSGISADYMFDTDTLGRIDKVMPYGIYFLEMDDFEKNGVKWTASPSIAEVGEFEDPAIVEPKMESKENSKPDSSSNTESSSKSDTPPNTGKLGNIAIDAICLVGFGALLVSRKKDE